MTQHNNSNLPIDLVIAFEDIVDHFDRDGDLSDADLANFEDTALRAAKALLETTKTRTQISKEIADIISTTFPMDNNNKPSLIVQGPIKVHSMCPHHLLPVDYNCYVGYLPKKDGNVLGLSKLARISKTLGQRPVLQEQLVNDIADVLHKSHPICENVFPSIDSEGSAVHLVGKHSCVSCRGIKDNSLTSMAAVRGCFEKGELETKFYKHIDIIDRTRL
jgi:GTP cyclohydrolase IA